jgi:2-keto-4-pentenoate hydratase/2-oxohepta-3-ene-1,7-dioic acid hydratase in catechol pathway
MKWYRFIDRQEVLCYGRELAADNTIGLLHGDPFTGLAGSGQRVGVKRLLAPVEPRAILCIGLNYRQHVGEFGGELPRRPVLFMKNPAAVSGPGAPILLPASCLNPPQVDYETELAVVIGRAAKNVSAAEALDYVLGYTIGNDVSARRWQKEEGGGQWVRGKSFDTFCPLGPALVTPDEILDPQRLRLSCTVNGQLVQDDTTANMIFPVAELIAYLSQDTTLLPGTVIMTGTPSGVGMARTPPLFLSPGDTVSMTIEPIGTLTNPVAAASRLPVEPG